MNSVGIILQLEGIYNAWGYQLVFLGSLIETSPIGFAIPGGLIVATGGFFAYGNNLSLVGIVISGWLGMLLTFLAAYFLGRKTGLSLAKKLKQESFAQQAKILLERHGAVILTTSLLANLTRFWVAYVAGAQRYNFIRFLFYAMTASLTWNSLLVIVGYLAGAERQKLESSIAKLGIISWILVIIALGIIYWKTKSELKQIRKK
ncbi:MAG: hypothetical protein UT08_C0005G0030 [Candidatus Woesebacteria bacterium GW2011_GWB1_38_8]|uniref:VTT domain-containing protein n=1 Tax=Candidatus Woesebacteria bacterium GW2011_GWB1_38_8 TaxID=1618570 RepID=A0A0G0NI48_9BACT|nr:MAG: hypothetical protein UT08_C0005G0030 [Candidatus Woesebacteria bacterium GW2011_GWB1_38_8]